MASTKVGRIISGTNHNGLKMTIIGLLSVKTHFLALNGKMT